MSSDNDMLLYLICLNLNEATEKVDAPENGTALKKKESFLSIRNRTLLSPIYRLITAAETRTSFLW